MTPGRTVPGGTSPGTAQTGGDNVSGGSDRPKNMMKSTRYVTLTPALYHLTFGSAVTVWFRYCEGVKSPVDSFQPVKVYLTLPVWSICELSSWFGIHWRMCLLPICHSNVTAAEYSKPSTRNFEPAGSEETVRLVTLELCAETGAQSATAAVIAIR